MQKNLTPSCIVANIPLASPSFPDISLQSSDSAVSIPISETSVFNSKWSNITIIGITVFLCTLKLPGSSNFKLCFYSSDIQANSAKLAEVFDLSNISSEYYEFVDIFKKLKLKSSLLIIFMTSKSIWKRILNLQLAPYILFWYPNKKLSRNSLRKTSTQVSSNQSHLHTVHWSYLLRRKMVHCISVLTSMILTTSLRKIIIHFCSFPIY